LFNEVNSDARFKGLNNISVFSKNREEWTLVDYACICYKLVLVPLYDTLGPENITYCLDHSECTTIFVSGTSVDTLIKTKDLAKLKNIVSFDPLTEA
jgi:long-chain acyl-CoA synthetase